MGTGEKTNKMLINYFNLIRRKKCTDINMLVTKSVNVYNINVRVIRGVHNYNIIMYNIHKNNIILRVLAYE